MTTEKLLSFPLCHMGQQSQLVGLPLGPEPPSTPGPCSDLCLPQLVQQLHLRRGSREPGARASGHGVPPGARVSVGAWAVGQGLGGPGVSCWHRGKGRLSRAWCWPWSGAGWSPGPGSTMALSPQRPVQQVHSRWGPAACRWPEKVPSSEDTGVSLGRGGGGVSVGVT